MNPTRTLAAAAAALLLATSAFGADGKIKLTPNSIKYKDAGMKKATGRSGSASLEVRALLSQNGTTTIEATTGSLDSGTRAPGSIDRLQLKAGKDVKNYNNLNNGGTFVVERTGLARYTPLQIQANISGIDARRTDVVTVQTSVARRPDLQIAGIDAPSSVRVGQPFNVSATIMELNGDVGARTDCLLTTTGGTVLDRAAGIWVDAGDSVQCMFSVTLSSVGTQSLQVRLANTKPADWGNPWLETATFRVTAHTASQWEAKSTQTRTYTRSVSTVSTNPGHPEEDSTDKTEDQFSFSGVIDQPIDYNNFSFFIEEWTDGNLIYRYDPAGGFLPDEEGTGCRMSDRRHAIYTVCKFGKGLAVNINTYSSKTVYVSSFWLQRYDPSTGQSSWYQAGYSRTVTSGPIPKYGNTHDVRIRITDGVDTWEARPYMVLQPWQEPEKKETKCYTFSDGTTRCTETTTRRSGKTGTDSEG